MSQKIKVLFVCLGNICRSPMAEALFNKKVESRALQDTISAASAGTAAYHVGKNADPRTLATLKKHGINFTHKAQAAQRQHFSEYDYVLAMDRENEADLHLMTESPEDKRRLALMLTYHGNTESKDVPDPYYGGADGFEKVYSLLDVALENLLNKIIEDNNLRPNAA